MQIEIANKLKLSTYSKDCIAVKNGNDTLISSRDIIRPCEWFYENGYKELKNRVLPMLIRFNDKDINDYPNSFDTHNYSINYDGKIEYIISDKAYKNNTRWIYNKKNLIERLYHLEINRLDAQTIEELVSGIDQLNDNFINKLKEIK